VCDQPGIGILDGSTCCKGKGGVSGGFVEFFPHWFEWHTVKCIRLVCEKLTIFPYGQYIIGNVFSLASDDITTSLVGTNIALHNNDLPGEGEI